ncbi:hypothetical protein F5883DRAFT_23320 [Diaporthe sp. PMI_573]|nr:hypothetical protein F5883DRAFT_23320 [Diaporthaceae sp. PMI_573]
MSTLQKAQYPLGHVPKGTVLTPDTELDTRSDEEIIKMLQSSGMPPHDERNVWAYWHTGFDAMPPWTKRNVIHWARVLGPSWTIRVLDNVPGSPHNASHLSVRSTHSRSQSRR